MKEIIDEPTSKEKIFKERAIWGATFLGGPLVGGYLLAENFKALGRKERWKQTWMATIAITIVIFTLVFVIPEDVDFPSYIIPLVYTTLASAVYKFAQEEEVNLHLENGGEFHSWWRVLIAGVIGLLVMVLALFAVFFLLV